MGISVMSASVPPVACGRCEQRRKVFVRRVHIPQATALVAVLLAYPLGHSYGATKQELQDAIAVLQQSVDADVAQDVQVVEVINALVAKPLSLTLGNVVATQGSAVDFPVIFKSGLSDISTLQFDVQLPAGITMTSAVAGPAATAAQKGVQSANVTGGVRVIVFGLNQTAIQTGVLVTMKLSVSATASLGKKVLPISGIVGSDPQGTSVALTGTSGSVTVR